MWITQKPSNNRICMLTHSIYASDPRVRREAEALVEMGYAVDVIALRESNGEAEQVINGVHIYGLPVSRHQGSGVVVYLLEYLSFCLLTLIRLSTLYFQRHYTLIQVHTPPDFLVFVTLLPRLMGTPVLLDLHELVPELFQERFGLAATHWIIRLLKFIEWAACAYAQAVLAVHERHKEVLIARGVNPAKITSIPNCPDERIFDPIRFNGQGNGYFTVLYHGAVVPRYGVDTLVQAVAQLRCQCPNLRLRILGSGDAWPAVRALVTELQLDDIVEMPGRVPLTEIPASISAAQVGVVPNHRNVYTNEILPTKLLEYMVMERPAVVASTQLVVSMFGGRRSMLFFEPGNALDLANQIAQLYHHPAKCEELVANARIDLKAFHWVNVKRNYMNVIDELIKKR